MGQNIRTFHICDVCRSSKENSDKPDGWEYVYYGQSWQAGAHRGNLDKKFLACGKCLKGEKLLFKKILSLFNPYKQESKE